MAPKTSTPFSREQAAAIYTTAQARKAIAQQEAQERLIDGLAKTKLDAIRDMIAEVAPKQTHLELRLQNVPGRGSLESECAAMYRAMGELKEAPYGYRVTDEGSLTHDDVDGTYDSPKWTISWI